MSWLWLALAGGLGAATRFVVDAEVGRRWPRAGLPLGTMVINVTGSLLLGLLTGWLTVHVPDPALKAVLGVGFLGGYTTFSTASVEAARLAAAGSGWRVLAHAGGMLLLSIAAAALGLWLGSR